MTKLKVYYAHFMAIYNTKQEERDIATLEALGLEVINPNHKDIEDRFKVNLTRMSYDSAFYEVFLTMISECDVFAFRALPDGRIPKGVVRELEQAVSCGIPVIELPSGMCSRKMNKEATIEYLSEIGQR